MITEQYIHIDTYGSKRTYKDCGMKVLHCNNGPAFESVNGNKSWYLNGEHFSEAEFNAITAPTIELTLEDIAAKFGVDVSKLKIVK